MPLNGRLQLSQAELGDNARHDFTHRSGGEARDPGCRRNTKIMQAWLRAVGAIIKVMATPRDFDEVAAGVGLQWTVEAES
jgi:hypothetical protein